MEVEVDEDDDEEDEEQEQEEEEDEEEEAQDEQEQEEEEDKREDGHVGVGEASGADPEEDEEELAAMVEEDVLVLASTKCTGRGCEVALSTPPSISSTEVDASAFLRDDEGADFALASSKRAASTA